jgi:hypothetical protein
VASSTSIADSLSHIVASLTYIVACAVLDSSTASSRRGLFHPTGHIVAFAEGPSGQAEQGEKVHFFCPHRCLTFSDLSTLLKPGTRNPSPGLLVRQAPPTGRSTLRSLKLLRSNQSPSIRTRTFGRGGVYRKSVGTSTQPLGQWPNPRLATRSKVKSIHLSEDSPHASASRSFRRSSPQFCAILLHPDLIGASPAKLPHVVHRVYLYRSCRPRWQQACLVASTVRIVYPIGG